MTQAIDPYAHFVEHPRYGRGPRITGLDPKPSDPGIRLNWWAGTHEERTAQHREMYSAPLSEWWMQRYNDRTIYGNRIPSTAVAADLERQTPATYAVTHYCDVERLCRDCRRPFIFFAEEQKHWYEELGFKLDVQCVRCFECRKRRQRLARQRTTYESLYHTPHRDIEQNLQFAETCLALMEAGDFTRRKTQIVRIALKAIPMDAPVRREPRFAALMERLLTIERRPDGENEEA